jgi:hypothetical protein
LLGKRDTYSGTNDWGRRIAGRALPCSVVGGTRTSWASVLAVALLGVGAAVFSVFGASSTSPSTNGVLTAGELPAVLQLSPSAPAARLAGQRLLQFTPVPGCGDQRIAAFVSAGSAKWSFDIQDAPKGPVVVSTNLTCSSPQAVAAAVDNYQLIPTLWASALSYAGTEGMSQAYSSTVRLRTPPAVTYTMTSFAVLPDAAIVGWWTQGHEVHGLVIIGAAQDPWVSVTTFFNLAQKVNS